MTVQIHCSHSQLHWDYLQLLLSIVLFSCNLREQQDEMACSHTVNKEVNFKNHCIFFQISYIVLLYLNCINKYVEFVNWYNA